MTFQTASPLYAYVAFLLLVANAHSLPAKAARPKSVSFLDRYPSVMNPALVGKIQQNAFLASAFHMPYAYAPLGGVGLGGGLASYNAYTTGGVTGAAAVPYYSNNNLYGVGGYSYNNFAPVAAGAAYFPTGAYSNSHESFYANHMGFPNGYSVNSKAAYVPSAYGYATLGGKQTEYDQVKGHPVGGVSRVKGVSYSGHNGVAPYNYGTHEEHVAVPGLTKVTYTHRYPVLPAFGMYPTYGAANGYYH